MNEGLRETLEFALMKIVSGGPRNWGSLRAVLVSKGFGEIQLDDNHQEITDLFLECLEIYGKGSTPYESERTPSLFSHRSLSPSASTLRFPERPCKSRPSEDSSPATSKQKIGGGWIGLAADIYVNWKATINFSFGLERGNAIGDHIIHRFKEHLQPVIQDGNIEIVCCIDSNPGRTHAVKCRVVKSELFDIFLGRHWDNPVQAQKEIATARRMRQGRAQQGTSGVPIGNIEKSSPLFSPEFLGRLLKEIALKTPSQTSPAAKVLRKLPLKVQSQQLGYDTEPEPIKQTRAKGKKPDCESNPESGYKSRSSRANTSYGNFPPGQIPGLISKGVRRKYDASSTSESASTTFDHDRSQEADESGSSPPESPIEPVSDEEDYQSASEFAIEDEEFELQSRGYYDD